MDQKTLLKSFRQSLGKKATYESMGKLCGVNTTRMFRIFQGADLKYFEFQNIEASMKSHDCQYLELLEMIEKFQNYENSREIQEIYKFCKRKYEYSNLRSLK